MAKGQVIYDMTLSTKNFTKGMRTALQSSNELLKGTKALEKEMKSFEQTQEKLRKTNAAVIANTDKLANSKKKVANASKAESKALEAESKAELAANKVKTEAAKLNEIEAKTALLAAKEQTQQEKTTTQLAKTYNVFARSARAVNSVTTKEGSLLNPNSMMGWQNINMWLDQAISKMTDFAKQGIKMASDVRESTDALASLTGSTNSPLAQWVEANSKNMGLSKADLYKYTAQQSQIATGQGYDLKSSATQSMITSLLARGTDIGSRTNKDIAQVMNNLTGVIFAGQARQGYNMGIAVTVADMQDYMKKQGIQGNFKDMSKKDQSNLRYQKAMFDTQSMKNDFKNTQTSFENMMRIFQSKWQDFLLNIGQKLLPMATGFVSLMSKALPYVEAIGNTFATWGPLLLGALAVMKAMVATQMVLTTMKAVADIGGNPLKALGYMAAFGGVAALVSSIGLSSLGNSVDNGSSTVGDIDNSMISSDTSAFNGNVGAGVGKGKNNVTVHSKIYVSGRQAGKAIGNVKKGTKGNNVYYH